MSSRLPEENDPFRRFRPGLTFKLIVPLTIGMCAVLAAHFATTVRRERLLFENTKKQYGRMIAHAMARRLADTWDLSRDEGADALQQELDELGDHVSVRWFPTTATSALTAQELETLQRDRSLTVVRRRGAKESLQTYVPVPPPGTGIVAVIDAFTDRDFYVRASVRRFLFSVALIVAVNALLAIGLSSWLVARPFARLIVKARQVGSGSLGIPLKLARRDEIGELGREMDRMSQSLLEADRRVQAEEAARRKAEDELQHAERLATIGKLAAGVAHEVGTPLNVISGRAKRLGRQHGTDTDLQKNVSIIQDQVDRVTQIVQQLLQFARRRKLSKSRIDLRELTRSTVAEVQPTVKESVRFTLSLDGSSEMPTQIDGRQIKQVLTNLIVNAAQAMPQGGRLRVDLSHGPASPPVGHPAAAGHYVRLSVEDQGRGIEPDDLPHIFEPFFTTKDVGDGTGLGLAVSHGIVQDHGGWIEVKTEVGKGTRFTVYLPGEDS